MATERQIDLAQKIMRAAIQVSVQGKYHVFVNYSGHVHSLSVDVTHADSVYDGSKEGRRLLGGFELMQAYLDRGANDWRDVDIETDKLEEVYGKIIDLLDVDADGVPL